MTRTNRLCDELYEDEDNTNVHDGDDDDEVAVEPCDVLVLGAGAAGIAAARALTKLGVKTVVVEGRSRVGGRAHTSDELGAGMGLDHGAKWVHGACSENRIVQLLQEEEAAETAAETRLQLNPLPRPSKEVEPETRMTPIFQLLSTEPSLASLSPLLSSTDAFSTATTASTASRSTSDSDASDSDNDQHPEMVEETRDDVAEMDPSVTMTRILLPAMNKNNGQEEKCAIKAMEPSPAAIQVAKDVFDHLMEFLEDPEAAIRQPHHQNRDDGDDANGLALDLENASLQDILLFKYRQQTQEQLNDSTFAQLCQDQLIKTNPLMQQALQILPTEEEQTDFSRQVMALLNLEINLFFDNWEGAPVNEVSLVHGLEGTILPGGNRVLPGGYGSLIKRLAQPLLQQQQQSNQIIRLNHRVVSVKTLSTIEMRSPSTTKIQVECQVSPQQDDNKKGLPVPVRTKVFEASACIIALPLGVLKAAVQPMDEEEKEHLRFEPPLPDSLCHSIQKLGVAVMDKVELAFPYQWWPENMERFTIACSHLNQNPTYHPWTSFIVESAGGDKQQGAITGGTPNVLVCYLHGDFAKEIEAKTNAQIQEECMLVLQSSDLVDRTTASLSKSDHVPDPLAIHVTRWFQDPLSRGCWTFYGKGSSPKDASNFRQNIECRSRGLFFAGEHTCDGSVPGDDLGCLHGAYLSGELAANSVVERLKAPTAVAVGQ